MDYENPYQSPLAVCDEPRDASGRRLIRVVAGSALRLLPAVAPAVVAEAIDMEYLGMLTPLLMMACGAWSGAYCHQTMEATGLREVYVARFAPKMELLLIATGMALGGIAFAVGFLNYVRPRPIDTQSGILIAWIASCGIIIPVDAGGLCDKRVVAMFSFSAGIGFTIVYPAWLFTRPGGRKISGVVALGCIGGAFLGFILYSEGAKSIGFRW